VFAALASSVAEQAVRAEKPRSADLKELNQLLGNPPFHRTNREKSSRIEIKWYSLSPRRRNCRLPLPLFLMRVLFMRFPCRQESP